MYNKKSLKNLKKFSSKNQPKKNGRPKGSLSLGNEFRKVLETTDPASKKPIYEIFVSSCIRHAIKGNAAYFKVIIERVDGKIPDKAEQKDKDRGPVTFRVIYGDEKPPEDEEE